MYQIARSLARRARQEWRLLSGPPGLLRGQARTTVAEVVRSKWNVIDAVDELRLPSLSFTCEICGFHAPRSGFRHHVAECAFLGGRLERYECARCGVIFGPEKMMRLSPAELGAEYRVHYQLFTEGDSTEPEIEAFRALHPKRGGVYLNYGGGAWSRSAEILRREGWDLWIYEPNAQTRDPRVIRSPEELRKRRFDGIMSNNVLEHLRQPVDALREMGALLKSSDARMSHSTACFRYCYEYTRFHLFFFTGSSFATACQQAGLVEESSFESGVFICKVLRLATT